MKFYDCATAPSPRRVRIFIAEKQLSIETVEIDMRNGEHRGEAFTAKNPRQTLPLLELDDGIFLTEAVAICDYLESLAPAPPLFGADPVSRAQVLMWNARCEMDGIFAVAEALRNHARGFRHRALTGPRDVEQIPALAERGRQRTTFFLEDLNERLAQSPYVAGEAYSIADITALVAVDFAGWVKVSMGPEHENLQRWYDEVSQRRAVSG